MFRYAQIDGKGYVVSDSHLSGIVEAENMVPLVPDFDLRNKRWNGTGWEDCEPEPMPPQADSMQADMDYIKMMVMREATLPATTAAPAAVRGGAAE